MSDRALKPGPSLTIALANLRLWFHLPRTLLMVVFMLILAVVEVAYCPLESPHLAETLYYYLSNGMNVLMSSSFLLLALSEAPNPIPYQSYCLIRSSRKRWLTGQLLYGFMITGMVLAWACLLIFLLSLRFVTPGSGWSETERVAAGLAVDSETQIPRFIRESFTPLQALPLALLPLFAFWLSLMAVQLLFGLLKRGTIGLMICVYAIFSNAFLIFPEDSLANWLLFIQYATLSSIAPQYTGMTYYYQVLAGYGCVLAALIALMYGLVSRCEMVFTIDKRC